MGLPARRMEEKQEEPQREQAIFVDAKGRRLHKKGIISREESHEDLDSKHPYSLATLPLINGGNKKRRISGI